MKIGFCDHCIDITRWQGLYQSKSQTATMMTCLDLVGPCQLIIKKIVKYFPNSRPGDDRIINDDKEEKTLRLAFIFVSSCYFMILFWHSLRSAFHVYNSLIFLSFCNFMIVIDVYKVITKLSQSLLSCLCLAWLLTLHYECITKCRLVWSLTTGNFYLLKI